MSKLNREWHEANPMPPSATLDQRVTWHLAHAEKCGCRDMPKSIKAELARRGALEPGRSALSPPE